MATIKNTRENDFTIATDGASVTIPGGRTVDGEFQPGTAEVPDAMLTEAMKKPVVKAWFEEGHLTKAAKAKAEDKKAD